MQFLTLQIYFLDNSNFFAWSFHPRVDQVGLYVYLNGYLDVSGQIFENGFSVFRYVRNNMKRPLGEYDYNARGFDKRT